MEGKIPSWLTEHCGRKQGEGQEYPQAREPPAAPTQRLEVRVAYGSAGWWLGTRDRTYFS